MKTVLDREFNEYGTVLLGYDCSELIQVLSEQTKMPNEGVIYVPSCEALENTKLYKQLQNAFYGGMPIQIGYCSGYNKKLNCLEYHRDSEVNISVGEIVLLVAKLQAVQNGTLNTSMVEAFLVPAGTAVQLYETTLHYAPAKKEGGFQVAVVLPRGTNTPNPPIEAANEEDRYLFARNKWLLAHPDTEEAKNGAYVGLLGDNIEL